MDNRLTLLGQWQALPIICLGLEPRHERMWCVLHFALLWTSILPSRGDLMFVSAKVAEDHLRTALRLDNSTRTAAGRKGGTIASLESRQDKSQRIMAKLSRLQDGIVRGYGFIEVVWRGKQEAFFADTFLLCDMYHSLRSNKHPPTFTCCL